MKVRRSEPKRSVRPAATRRRETSPLSGLWATHGRASLIAAATAGGIVLAAFLPVVRNGFVNWDDNVWVYENAEIRSLDAAFWTAAFGFRGGNWCPLTWISHALDHAIWGLRPAGHHLTSAVLHALNTFLFVLVAVELVRRGAPAALFRNRGTSVAPTFFTVGTAGVAGLFFGLSPLRVESVAWASERRDVLFLFFGLIAVLAYLAYAAAVPGRRRAVLYGTSLAAFALGLMSKPMLVTLPAVLVLLDWYPLGRLRGGVRALKWALIDKAPFLVLAAGSSVVTFLAQSSAGAVRPLAQMAPEVRFWFAIRSYGFYLWKTILPVDLSCLYVVASPIDVRTLSYRGSLLLLLAVTGACILLLGRTRLYAALWGFYLLTLLPVSGIVQVGDQFAADRYTYFPGLALALGVGLAAGRVYLAVGPLEGRFSPGMTALGAALAALLGLQASLTVRQIGVWRDSVTLWNRTIALYPRILATPYTCRGAAHLDSGDFPRAIDDWNTAIELQPGDGGLYFNRAIARIRGGDSPEGVRDIVKAAQLGDAQARRFLSARGLQW